MGWVLRALSACDMLLLAAAPSLRGYAAKREESVLKDRARIWGSKIRDQKMFGNMADLVAIISRG